MMHMYDGGWWYHPGWLFQLLIFLAFFLVFWWLVKNGIQGRKEEPVQILKRRLAEGEITKEEFKKLKKELE